MSTPKQEGALVRDPFLLFSLLQTDQPIRVWDPLMADLRSGPPFLRAAVWEDQLEVFTGRMMGKSLPQMRSPRLTFRRSEEPLPPETNAIFSSFLPFQTEILRLSCVWCLEVFKPLSLSTKKGKTEDCFLELKL